MCLRKKLSKRSSSFCLNEGQVAPIRSDRVLEPSAARGLTLSPSNKALTYCVGCDSYSFLMNAVICCSSSSVNHFGPVLFEISQGEMASVVKSGIVPIGKGEVASLNSRGQSELVNDRVTVSECVAVLY